MSYQKLQQILKLKIGLIFLVKDIEKSLSCHERVASTEKKIVDIETTLNDSSLKSVQSELDGVKKVVFETQRQVNDLEQYGRRSNIRIFGLEIHENDKYVDKVTSFLVDRLPMNLVYRLN